MFRYPLWSCLISCPPEAPEFISLITAIFSDKKEIVVVQNLGRANAQTFIDRLDTVSLLNFDPGEPSSLTII